MHRVVAYFFALDRLEGACAHMEGQFAQLHTFLLEAFQHLGREMQARRRCCHRTLYLGIHRLVRLQVALLGFAVEIGRYGQFANGI